MDEQAWAIVGIAAGIATAVATAVTALTAIWWRYLDRQEADWVLLNVSATWKGGGAFGDNPEYPYLECELANAGDGAAFRVELRGLGCTPRFEGGKGSEYGASWSTLEVTPALRPGEQVHLRVACESADWEHAVVVIEWLRSPTWRRRHSRRSVQVRIAEIAELPMPLGSMPVPPRPQLPDGLRAKEPLPTENHPRWRRGPRTLRM